MIPAAAGEAARKTSHKIAGLDLACLAASQLDFSYSTNTFHHVHWHTAIQSNLSLLSPVCDISNLEKDRKNKKKFVFVVKMDFEPW